MNPIETLNKNGYWMPTVVLDRKLSTSRDQLIEIFNNHNIDARVFFWPLSTLDFIDQDVHTPVSFDLSQRSLNLPSYHDITQEDQLRVIEVLKSIN
jgi:perosamine synthetase